MRRRVSVDHLGFKHWPNWVLPDETLQRDHHTVRDRQRDTGQPGPRAHLHARGNLLGGARQQHQSGYQSADGSSRR
jgi:hypothetical protein